MISHSGRDFETHVNEVCGSVKPAEKISDGVFEHNGHEIRHEQKGKESDKGGLNTNQVRPIKYNTLVFQLTTQFREKFGIPSDAQYFIVPPNIALRLSAHGTGQHTPDAIMCTNMPMNKTAFGRINFDPLNWYADDSDLKNKIITAYFMGEQDVQAKQFALTRRKLYEVIVEENHNFLG